MDKNGCRCCCEGEALFYEDEDNCVYVDDDGTILQTINSRDFTFKVKCCPNCGRKFNQHN